MDSVSNLDVGRLLNTYVIPLGWKVVGAVAIWIIGGFVIRAITGCPRAA